MQITRNWDTIQADFDAALVRLAETGEAPIAIAHLVTRVAERDGVKVYLTMAAPNGDFIAASRCDNHPDNMHFGCACR